MLCVTLKILLIFFRDIYDKMRSDLRMMKEEAQRIETSRAPKERSLGSLQTSLDSMQTSAESLKQELGSCPSF